MHPRLRGVRRARGKRRSGARRRGENRTPVHERRVGVPERDPRLRGGIERVAEALRGGDADVGVAIARCRHERLPRDRSVGAERAECIDADVRVRITRQGIQRRQRVGAERVARRLTTERARHLAPHLGRAVAGEREQCSHPRGGERTRRHVGRTPADLGIGVAQIAKRQLDAGRPQLGCGDQERPRHAPVARHAAGERLRNGLPRRRADLPERPRGIHGHGRRGAERGAERGHGQRVPKQAERVRGIRGDGRVAIGEQSAEHGRELPRVKLADGERGRRAERRRPRRQRRFEHGRLDDSRVGHPEERGIAAHLVAAEPSPRALRARAGAAGDEREREKRREATAWQRRPAPRAARAASP